MGAGHRYDGAAGVGVGVAGGTECLAGSVRVAAEENGRVPGSPGASAGESVGVPSGAASRPGAGGRSVDSGRSPSADGPAALGDGLAGAHGSPQVFRLGSVVSVMGYLSPFLNR